MCKISQSGCFHLEYSTQANPGAAITSSHHFCISEYTDHCSCCCNLGDLPECKYDLWSTELKHFKFTQRQKILKKTPHSLDKNFFAIKNSGSQCSVLSLMCLHPIVVLSDGMAPLSLKFLHAPSIRRRSPKQYVKSSGKRTIV